MSIDALVELVHSPLGSDWQERNQAAFDGLFGAGTGRYPAAAKGAFRLRAPDIRLDSGIPFSAYIHPENPTSGQYAGLSFVLFPVEAGPCLLGFVVGTGGLGADQEVLGRPGHARKAQAICAWLNREYGKGEMVAWAKLDPTRTDIGIPADVTARMANYKRVFDRYGKEM
jgi:5-methylcytosine-specific restriction enzyme B